MAIADVSTQVRTVSQPTVKHWIGGKLVASDSGRSGTVWNPATGEAAMPTIGSFIQLLPEGFATQPYRSTDGTVFVCVEGDGETRVGDTIMHWHPHDIFVVPSWMAHTHRAAREAVLFSFSDRPVQEKLGLWREARYLDENDIVRP